MPAKKPARIGRPPSPEGPAVLTAIRLHPKLLKRVARLCKRLGLSRSGLIRELLEGKLEEEGL